MVKKNTRGEVASNGRGRATHRKLVAPRYSGRELHEKVVEAAEAEIERRYHATWDGHPSPIRRPGGGGWRYWVRDMTGFMASWRQDLDKDGNPVGPRRLVVVEAFEEMRAWMRRYVPLRQKLLAAFREARADKDVWAALLEECPELEVVHFTENALVNTGDVLSYQKAQTLEFRLQNLQFPMGPAWRLGDVPTNRDLALLVILSGWVPETWSGSMTIAEAIQAVMDSVRTARTSRSRSRKNSGW